MSPRITLLDPADNNYTNNGTNMWFNFSVADETASTLTCNLLINSTSYAYSATVSNNTETYFVANQTLTGGSYYNWSVNCTDGTNMNKSLGRNLSILLPADTCTCPASPTNWGIDLTDRCNITIACNVDGYTVSFENGTTGDYCNIYTTITADEFKVNLAGSGTIIRMANSSAYLKVN
jgi:hypothetical protein